MKTIDCEDLKTKLDRGDVFKLVMTLEAKDFNAMHIPGSINICTQEDAQKILQSDEEIIVYCSGVECVSSQNAYYLLVRLGYTNVRRYVGGLASWEEAGYPMEGGMVK